MHDLDPTSPCDGPLDLIDELRLRRWALENGLAGAGEHLCVSLAARGAFSLDQVASHLPEQQTSEEWRIQQIQAELARSSRAHSIVPLMPDPVGDGWRHDEAHAAVPAPRLLLSLETVINVELEVW